MEGDEKMKLGKMEKRATLWHVKCEDLWPPILVIIYTIVSISFIGVVSDLKIVIYVSIMLL